MRKSSAARRQPDAAQRELRRRIALSNRPRLGVGINQLDEVSSTLARSAPDRAHFTQNPTRYLQARSMPVSSCELPKTVSKAPQQTAEVCSSAVAVICSLGVQQMTCVAFSCGTLAMQNVQIYAIGPRLFEEQQMFSLDNSAWGLDLNVL